MVINMYECCKTCHYFREVRKYPTYQEVLTHICLFHVIEENIDYVMETVENDMCECWLKLKE